MNQPDTPNSTVRFLTVGENQDGQRLDNFLITALKGAPRTLVYRIVRTGEVRVNKGRARPDTRVHDGDIVRVPPLRLAEENPAPVAGARLTRSLRERVIYHQDGLIVLNKPAGLAVHGGSGVPFGVIEAMRSVFPEKDFLELVHRLDRDTSGLLMVAEKRSVLRELHEQLRQGRMRKTYVALLAGNLKGGQHTVTAPLHKGNLPNGERIVRVSRDGKEAKTVFKVIERFANATLVEASPLTGRTHQIRVHAQFLGHPILGDEKYGQDETNKAARAWGLNRLFLHARALTLTLPGKEKPLALESPLADDLQSVLEVLRHAPV